MGGGGKWATAVHGRAFVRTVDEENERVRVVRIGTGERGRNYFVLNPRPGGVHRRFVFVNETRFPSRSVRVITIIIPKRKHTHTPTDNRRYLFVFVGRGRISLGGNNTHASIVSANPTIGVRGKRGGVAKSFDTLVVIRWQKTRTTRRT